MTDIDDISPGVAGLQTRLVIETITQVVPGAEIVEIVGSLDETIPGFDAESWAAPGTEHALVHIRKRVVSLLGSQSSVTSFSCVVSSVAWGVLVEPIAAAGRRGRRRPRRRPSRTGVVEPRAGSGPGLRRPVEPHGDPGLA